MDNKAELEQRIDSYLQEYVSRNHAAQVAKEVLDSAGIGVKPLIDHITIRTYNIDRRAQEFLPLGYAHAETLEYSDWHAKVYRAPGFPALFVDQAYDDDRGATSVIPRWVEQFSDQTLHHIAILVEDIEAAMHRLQDKGITFAGSILGEKGDVIRQIFSVPEQVDGAPFSVLELIERHAGYQGFSPPQADALMQSTVTT
ncbi:MAG: VOC family protein [Nitrospirae bacterium]|nr:VOC family protein [Nitrospirota bacterium]MDA1304693.1 VOC family protein [Nitrospirota bacterium]